MTGNGKPRFAMYWAAGCGGCEIAVLNTGERILDLDANFDVVFWPVAMDAKYADLAAMDDGSILLTLFNGGIRNAENEHLARLLRQKSQILVAFGSCACEGCIPGLANFTSREEIFDTVYQTVTTDNPGRVRPLDVWPAPEGELRLPAFADRLRTLDQIVPVDYYLPGCPPESRQVAAVIDLVIAVLRGEAEWPPRGSVIGAGTSTVCDECPRARRVKSVQRFVRIQDGRTDPALCLLEQGIPCNGVATRSGCGALCPKAGAQCIGCYGPADGVLDYGARLMSALASVIEATDPDEIERVLDGIPDPAGQCYRFSLASSLVGSDPGRKA